MKTTTIFFDLETGGVEDHHPDIQLAAAAIRDWEVLEVFERKIRFDLSAADARALEINSFHADAWQKEAVEERHVVSDFAAFLESHRIIQKRSRAGNPYLVARLAGHNVARFDAPRLVRMFARHGAFLPADAFMPLDTMQLALWRFADAEKKPENFKLETLCRFFGISTEGAHDAWIDVENTAQLARRLLEGEIWTG